MPPTIHIPSSRAQWPRNAWIGPSPATSATSSLSASLRPMIAKFSGSAASTAPCACARSSNPRAVARFAATSGLEVIWMTAATDKVITFPYSRPVARRL